MSLIYENGNVVYKTSDHGEKIIIHKIMDTNFIMPSHTFSNKDFPQKNYTFEEIKSVIKDIMIQQIYNMHVF